MRVNVYEEELTDFFEVIEKGPRKGIRFYLHLPVTRNGEQIRGPFTHTSADDDTAGVTFWATDPARLQQLLLGALDELEEECGLSRPER